MEILTGAKESYEEIKRKSKYYSLAATWLHENIDRLAKTSVDNLFVDAASLRWRNDSIRQQTTINEAKQLLEEDIRTYLSWIRLYMSTGSLPKNFKAQHSASLILSTDTYQNIFSEIKYSIVPEAPFFPLESAQVIIRYLNRFLIQKNLDEDL